jgi:hypothetical protein
VQDAEVYQRLLDVAASADAVEDIRQGLDDIAHGRTRPPKKYSTTSAENMTYLVEFAARASRRSKPTGFSLPPISPTVNTRGRWLK